MDKKAVGWLYEQLPELVEKGIIPSESVDLIKKHYGAIDKKLGGRIIVTMFAIIGTILVGLGIILILAHNWDQMNRLTRTALAVGLLVSAQILAGFVIWFKKDDAVWTESTGTFLLVTIGASIALIGQTYHLADNFNTALLIWMLLSIPIVYLMGVTTPALLYLVGITIWVSTAETHSHLKHLIWPLFALVIPYYWNLLKIDRYANQPVLLSWLFIFCFYISFGIAVESSHLYILNYVSLFALTYFIGINYFTAQVNIWKRPFTLLGITGCVGMSILLTFKDTWWLIGRGFSAAGRTEYLLSFALLALIIALASRVIKKKTNNYLLFSLVPAVVTAGFVLLKFDESGINATVLCNAYLLFAGVNLILRGVRSGSLGVLNIGMLLVAFLILMRFFDFNFSFVARGIVFLLIGSCFLATNLIMARRKKEVEHEKN